MELENEPAWDGPGRLLRLDAAGRGTPVLLTHGTFSNAETCIPLAQALSARPVYVIEWRGRDIGPERVQDFDYDDLSKGEIAAAVKAIGGPVHLVGHSGGGLAMLLALHNAPDLRAHVRSLTMIASQATHLRDASWRFRWMTRALDRLGRRRGYWPVRLLRIGTCNESAGLMHQWVRWNRAGEMRAADGRNVLPGLAGWRLPAFVLAGAGDRDIAPVAGCRHIATALGTRARFHLCAADTDGEDFTHARLIRSQAAARHVWPRISAFLDEIDAARTAA